MGVGREVGVRSRKWAWGPWRGIFSSRALETRDLAVLRRRFVCGRGHGKSSTVVSSRNDDAPVASIVGTVAAIVDAVAAVAAGAVAAATVAAGAFVSAIVALAVVHSS